MNRRTRRFLSTLGLLVAAAAATACSSVGDAVETAESVSGGAVSVEGAGGSEEPSGGSSEQATSAGGVVRRGTSGKRLREAYAEFTWRDCKHDGRIRGIYCDSSFWQSAGMNPPSYEEKRHVNPRRVLDNPDPEWLPGWEKLPAEEGWNKAKRAFRAMALAAVRKTWLKRCHADFEKLWKRSNKLDATVEDVIAKAKKEETAYGRLVMLLETRNMFADDLPPFLRQVGARHKLEVAIKRAFEETGREFVYWQQELTPKAVHSVGTDLAPLRPRVGEALERIHYCYRAMHEDRAPVTPELPTYSNDTEYEDVLSLVRPAVSRESHERAMEKITPGGEHFQKEFTREKRVDTASLLNAREDTAGERPVWFENDESKYELKSVETSDDETLLRFYGERKDSHRIPGSCRTTDKIERVHPDGTVEYRTVCKYQPYVKETRIRVRVPADEIPPEQFEIQKGDTVGLYGRLLESKGRKLSGPPDKRLRDTIVLELIHLHRVASDGETTIGPFF